MGLFDRMRKDKGITIASPAAGRCVSLKQVPDPAFSEEILGKGVAIEPSDGRFYAPADGEVTTLFPTFHAVGVRTAEGADILIHVGLDTVKLEGRHFTAHVRQGDTVRKGELLLEADLAAIVADGYQTVTPVLLCNTDEFRDAAYLTDRDISVGDALFQLKR